MLSIICYVILGLLFFLAGVNQTTLAAKVTGLYGLLILILVIVLIVFIVRRL